MAFVTPTNVTVGSVLTASRSNADVTENMTELAPFFAAWQSYTPALTASTTNPTLGTGGGTTGAYLEVGKLIVGWFNITFGTAGTNAGSGVYTVSLPATGAGTGGDRYVGFGHIRDVGGVTYGIHIRRDGQINATGVAANAVVSNSVPMAWGANDLILGNFMYEAA